jgi:hypothetical protein
MTNFKGYEFEATVRTFGDANEYSGPGPRIDKLHGGFHVAPTDGSGNSVSIEFTALQGPERRVHLEMSESTATELMVLLREIHRELGLLKKP